MVQTVAHVFHSQGVVKGGRDQSIDGTGPVQQFPLDPVFAVDSDELHPLTVGESCVFSFGEQVHSVDCAAYVGCPVKGFFVGQEGCALGLCLTLFLGDYFSQAFFICELFGSVG